MTIIVYDRAARQIAADRLLTYNGASFEVTKLHRIAADGGSYIVGAAGDICAVGEFLAYIRGDIKELPLSASGKYAMQAIVVDANTGAAVVYEGSQHPIPLDSWGAAGASEPQFAAQVLHRMGMTPEQIVKAVSQESGYRGCDVLTF